MRPDDPFEPKLGKIRAQAPKAPKSFHSKVMHAAGRAGGMKSPSNGGRPAATAKRSFGRGAGVGRVLVAAPRTGPTQRRVVVKARFVKLAGKGLKAAAAHLSYIQRDGVTREGRPGELYGRDTDRADGAAFIERSADDRHQFRFIVAPEDGAQIDDLKAYTQRLMAAMEKDLGTKLDWVAVDHFNTGHPHSHIIVRGRDDQGKDLVIAREYLTQGIRERAEALVTLDLGPRSDLEINAQRQAEVEQERLTSIDRYLRRDADENGLVLAGHHDPLNQALRAGRLAKLGALGLAIDEGEGRWRLRSDIEATLRQLGERGDIIKTMHHELTARHMEAALADSVIHERTADGQPPVPITGRLLTRGLADEHSDRHFVLLEGTDGRVHYVDIGEGDRTDSLAKGTVIRVTPKAPAIKAVDRTIVDVAERNGGRYDIDAHLKADPTARQTFAETHVRRLEAIRKVTGGLVREPDGRFVIGADYLDKALAYEQREVARSPVRIEVLSTKSLEAQTRFKGVTWLDHELIEGNGPAYATGGFGGEARNALRLRQQWLIEEGLATSAPAGQVVSKDVLVSLQRREFVQMTGDLSRAIAKPFTEARPGELIEGKLRQAVATGMGKFAVVERSRDFTLVPWRDVLEKHVGKDVSGIMRSAGINWSIGRGKDIGID